MLRDGALLCSIKGIIKGDVSNFRLISDKNLLYQHFVQHLVKILKTFHFVQKCTHLECQWNVLFYYFPHIYPKFGCHGNWNLKELFPKSGTCENIRPMDMISSNRMKISCLDQKIS